MEKLHTKEWLEEHLEEVEAWQKEAFIHFRNIVADTENKFPCIVGRQGFLAGHMRFCFLGDPREKNTAIDLAAMLKEYGEISRGTGKYSSLIALFDTPQEMIETYSIEAYEDMFWSVLNRISAQDSTTWPEEIPTDPAHHSWEFCFDNEPYFCSCFTTAHKERRSRYFPLFMIVFQPRWVFEGMNDSTAFGRNTKRQIRALLKEYDQAPLHLDLKWYGQEDNYEWKQYFLRDDSTSLSKCPFSKK